MADGGTQLEEAYLKHRPIESRDNTSYVGACLHLLLDSKEFYVQLCGYKSKSELFEILSETMEEMLQPSLLEEPLYPRNLLRYISNTPTSPHPDELLKIILQHIHSVDETNHLDILKTLVTEVYRHKKCCACHAVGFINSPLTRWIVDLTLPMHNKSCDFVELKECLTESLKMHNENLRCENCYRTTSQEQTMKPVAMCGQNLFMKLPRFEAENGKDDSCVVYLNKKVAIEERSFFLSTVILAHGETSSTAMYTTLTFNQNDTQSWTHYKERSASSVTDAEARSLYLTTAYIVLYTTDLTA